MAKAKLGRPVPHWAPSDWAPLMEAAERIEKHAGGWHFAGEELRRHALVGELEVAAIVGERRFVLAPAAWKTLRFLYDSAGRTRQGGRIEKSIRVYGTYNGEKLEVYNSWRFFVRRAGLDRIYPSSEVVTVDVKKPDWTFDAAAASAPPRRRTGPATTHEWHRICGEIARRCIDPQTGCVQVPKSERKLAEGMLLWCQDQTWDEPADSAMRVAVKHICAALRTLQR
jgi:hypothetical protein